jgi:hypothetical protein
MRLLIWLTLACLCLSACAAPGSAASSATRDGASADHHSGVILYGELDEGVQIHP